MEISKAISSSGLPLSTVINKTAMEKFSVNYSDWVIGPYNVTTFKKDLIGRL